MKKKTVIYIIILLLIILYLINVKHSNQSVEFMTYNLIFDCVALYLYIRYLNSFRVYLFPSAIFVFFFYIYEILGKFVWIYRENNWFNEDGKPEHIAMYFSIIGCTLITISCIGFKIGYKKAIVQRSTKKPPNYLFIRKNVLRVFTGITFIGAFIFTSGFTIIPLLSASMDKARVDLVSQDSGGRGFGFFFLLFGILGVSLSLFSISKLKSKKEKWQYIFYIVVISFLLALYSGRFLPLMPFIIYLICYLHNRKFNISRVAVLMIFGSLAFLLIMFFGAVRQFGSGVSNDLAMNYLIADSFPEFRMTVYIDSMNHKNLMANFLYTIIAGLLPGFVFSPLGIAKNDYFKPIGAEVLKVTQFDPATTPGIRTSLFGELSFTGPFMYVFIICLFFVLVKLDTLFFSKSDLSYSKYKYISLAVFLSFSIPYGSLFLVSVIEWAILVEIINKYFVNGR